MSIIVKCFFIMIVNRNEFWTFYCARLAGEICLANFTDFGLLPLFFLLHTGKLLIITTLQQIPNDVFFSD